MKRIVCFGDSNTWGYEPASGQRFAENVRWTGVLASILGPDFRIIEEGLNARTTAFDDPVEGLHKNGRAYLLPCLESHAPLDLVIIMLGTNDLKQRFRLPASDIAEAAGSLVKMAHQSQAGPDGQAPAVLLVSPIAVAAEITSAEISGIRLGQKFGADSRTRSLMFPVWFAEIAQLQGCAFFDAASVASASPLDAIHLDAQGHQALGQALAQEVKRILGE